MSHTTVTMSLNPNIDGILSGVRWNGVFSYGFPSLASEYGSYAWLLDHDNNPSTPPITVNETVGFQSLNALQQAVTDAVFAEFGALTNTSALRREPGGGADIRLAMSTTGDPGNTTAYAKYPGDGNRDGDVWFNTTSYNAPRLGTYAYQTFFHEIGHAVGLKHGHEADNGNNNVLTTDRDSLEFSTMTYRSFVGAPTTGGYSVQDGHFPQTFMMLDVAALQYMYGADFTTNAGNTIYRFDPANGQMLVNGLSQGVPQNNAGTDTNVLFRTIWDGNGVDTYDFSAYGAGRQLLIDLAPGGWTDVDSDSNFQAARLGTSGVNPVFSRGQVFNALLSNGDARSLIENAIGGAGDDWIKGNQANNHLWGNDGRDVLEGFGGNDILDAGITAGGSEMYGGNGLDTIWAGPGADYIDGGNGVDTVNYTRSTAGILIDTTAGKVSGGWATEDTLVSIEQLYATSFDDRIAMGDEANWVSGGDGRDRIDGRGGNDVLRGDNGDDILRGGHGADFLIGGAGWDIVVFDTAATINLATGVHGGEAAGDIYSEIEQFNGSNEADTMVAANWSPAYFIGGDGADALYGADMNDWLQGGKGADYINGGSGSDTVSYADAPNAIIAELYLSDGTTDGKITAGEWGPDTLVSIENIEGTSFGDRIYGDERANTLTGLAGDDILKGDVGGDSPPPSNDTLYGGSGNDILDGGGGADYMEGGSGNDTFYVDTNSDAVREAPDGGIDTVIALASFNLHATLAEVEVLMTSDAAATTTIDLRGSNFNNTLIGNAGANTLDGFGGDDTIIVTPDSFTDILIGGDGFDTMEFIVATTADWQSGILDAYVGLDSWASWEAIQGSSGDDRIRTNSWGFAVELRGGDGNDVLATGVTGVVSDTLFGEAGNDQLNGGAGNDRLYGGGDNDILVGMSGNDILKGGSGKDLLKAGSGNDNINGGSGRDTIVVSAGHDVIDGGSGKDTFDFSGFGKSAITINLASGSFLHFNGQDVQSFTSIENVIGTRGDDTITGSFVNNTLQGGRGADTLTGGDGRDQFTYTKTNESGTSGALRDVIKDFTIAPGGGSKFVDRIDLSEIDAKSASASDQAFTFIGDAGFTAAGQLRVVQAGSNAIVSINTTGTSGSEMSIVLQNVTAADITAADFIL